MKQTINTHDVDLTTCVAVNQQFLQINTSFHSYNIYNFKAEENSIDTENIDKKLNQISLPRHFHFWSDFPKGFTDSNQKTHHTFLQTRDITRNIYLLKLSQLHLLEKIIWNYSEFDTTNFEKWNTFSIYVPYRIFCRNKILECLQTLNGLEDNNCNKKRKNTLTTLMAFLRNVFKNLKTAFVFRKLDQKLEIVEIQNITSIW